MNRQTPPIYMKDLFEAEFLPHRREGLACFVVAGQYGPAMLVRSVLVSLALDEVQRDRESLVKAHFSPAEQTELAARHVRSTAGRLALKRAILQLLADERGQGLTESDIVLARLPTGRPVLVSVLDDPAAPLADRLLLSISHTKTTAYGLAVRQGD